MLVTLKELAEKLNVSASTISRVVNNKNYVKPETRRKILKALKEYNYTPNQIARSLKVRMTKTIAVIVPDITEVFFSYAIKGIDNVLSQNDYKMIVCDTDESPEKEELYLNMLLQHQVDGIILATVSREHKLLYRYFERDISVVFFDNLPNIREKTDSVLTDNIKASEIATEHLVKLGHMRIGIVAGKQDETTGYERILGYKQTLSNNRLPIDDNLIAIGDFKEKSGFDCMEKLLDANKDITAVYITSSKMTYGAIKAIKERGLRIPSDIALVGFDVHDESGLINPGITTIYQNEEHIGKVAGELLLKRLKNKEDIINQKIILEPKLIIRESCGYKE